MNTNNYAYPSHLIPDSKKDSLWRLQYAKAMYHDFINNKAFSMFYNARVEYKELLDYAQGLQSTDQFKKRMDVWEEQDKTWINLDWRIFNLATKDVNKVTGKMNRVDYDVILTAIDAVAQDQRAEYDAKITAMRHLREFNQNLAKLSGLNVEAMMATAAGEDGMPLPSMEELEMMDDDEQQLYMQVKYKHQFAMQMEMGLKLVNHVNNVQQVFKEVDYNLFVLGVAATKDGIGVNGFPTLRSVDPMNLIISRTNKEDHSDITHAGEIRQVTISELRTMDKAKRLKEKDYQEIADKYKGRNLNPAYYHGTFHIDDIHGYPYDECRVSILEFEFKSDARIVKQKKKNKFGNTSLYDAAYYDDDAIRDYNEKWKGEREIIYDCYQVVHEGIWIIDTPFIINDGIATDMVRLGDALQDVKLSYHIYAPNMKLGRVVSLFKSGLPIYDSAQQDWLKLQDMVAKAIPKGHAIDLDALEDAAIGKGGKNLTKKQLLDLLYKRGTYVYRGSKLNGKIQGNLPIREMENGLSKDIMNILALLRSKIEFLQAMYGFNAITDGVTPPERMVESAVDIADSNTNDALDFLFHAKKWLFEDSMKSLADRVISAAQNGGIEGVIKGHGKRPTQFIKIHGNIGLHQYGLQVENKPTAAEWQRFYVLVDTALANKEITLADATFIYEIDNLKQARQVLVSREKRNRRIMQQQKEREIMLNNEGAAEAAERAEMARQQSLQIEYQLKSQYESVLTEKELHLLDAKFKADMQLKQMDLQIASAKASQQSESSLLLEYLKGNQKKEQIALDAQLNPKPKPTAKK